MTEARVPLRSADEAMASAEEHGVPGPLAALSVFRLLLRRPRAAKATADLLGEPERAVLAATEIPLEDGVASWPPDGLLPT